MSIRKMCSAVLKRFFFSHLATFYLCLVSHREMVIQKVASCCRRGNQVSYKYSKVGWFPEVILNWLTDSSALCVKPSCWFGIYKRCCFSFSVTTSSYYGLKKEAKISWIRALPSCACDFILVPGSVQQRWVSSSHPHTREQSSAVSRFVSPCFTVFL